MAAEGDERQSAWVCFQRFLAFWTVDLKTQMEEVNQRLELDFEDLILVERACQVKKKVQCCKQSTVSIQRDFGGFIMSRDDMLSSGGIGIRLTRPQPKARKC